MQNENRMTGAEMKRLAVMVYGPIHWAGALSVALGVNRRTIERAAAGVRPIPDGWRDELKGLLADHVNKIVAALESL